MATVSLNLDISAKGLAGLVELSDQFNKNMQAGAAASKAAGGTAGSRALSSSAAPSGSSAAAYKAENTTYNQARGMGSGTTGSATSDFAAQARGLGGLVHLYATFAANLFAAEAAFRALSGAMNTANMIKGLDQLGAASGKSLGSLAKQMMDATDGAISLKEAMAAVAQGSSGGMSSKQMLEMADVAKKASQALGVNMPDAISRLSRGITKIEPELLDEIGIMVRVDTAAQKYALSVGKTASSLSDLEKRQAFANAVLEQGKEKFSQIDIPANPYDKLLASMTNLATTGLGLVNNVLAPIAKILAESPTALATALGMIGLSLVKQALPALAAFRENAAKAAQEAAAMASKRSEESKAATFGIFTQARKAAQDAHQVEKQILQDSLQNMLAGGNISTKSKAFDIITRAAKDVTAVTEEELKHLEKTSMSLEKKGKIAAAERYKDIVENIEITKLQAKAEQEAAEKEFENLKKNSSVISNVNIQQRIADEANRKATVTRISSQWAERTQTEGFIKATVKGWQELGEARKSAENPQGVGVLRAGLSGITNTLKSGAMGLINLAASATNIIAGIGAVVAIYQLLDTVLSNSAKQQQDFTSKTQDADSAIKTLNDSFDLYTTKKKNAFSVDSIVAFSTALTGVSNALEGQITSFKKYKEVENIWDALKDSISGIFGKSNIKQLTKSAVGDIQAVVKSLEFSSNKSSSIGAIANTLRIDPSAVTNAEALNGAFNKLSETDRVAKLEEINNVIKRIAEQEAYAANATQAFSESLKQINKITDQIIATNAFTDLQGKLGEELVHSAGKFAQALRDPLKALASIDELAKDPKALAALNMSTEDINRLGKASDLIKQISDAEKELTKAKAQQFSETDPEHTNNEYAKYLLSSAQDKLDSLRKQATEFAISQQSLLARIYAAGFEKIELGLKHAKELANISIAKTDLGYQSQLGIDTSGEMYKLSMQEINIQKELIDASYKAEIATAKNTEELSKLTANMQLLSAQAIQSKPGATDDEKALGKAMAESASKTLEMYLAKQALKSDPTKYAKFYAGTEAGLAAENSSQGDKILDKKRESALAAQNAKAAQEREKREMDHLKALAKQKQDSLTLDTTNLNIYSQYLNLAGQLNSYNSEALISEKSKNQLKLIGLDYEAKSAAIQSERDQLAKTNISVSSEEYKRQKAYLDNKQKALDADRDAKVFVNQLNTIRDKGVAILAKEVVASNLSLESDRLKASVAEARIANLNSELSLKQQLGVLDDSTANTLKKNNDLEAQKLKYIQESAKIQSEVDQKTTALKNAQDVANEANKNASKMENIGNLGIQQTASAANDAVATAQKELDLAKEKKINSSELNELVIANIKNISALNQQLIDQKAHLDAIAGTTQTLAILFGDVGKAIGDAAAAMDTFSTNSAKNAAKIANAASDKEREELRKKFAKSELLDIANVAAAIKKTTHDKTIAYKAANAAEKGAALERMSLAIKETDLSAENISKQMQGIGEWIEKAKDGTLVDSIAAVVKQGVTGDPWTAIPRMLAMASFISSLTGESVSAAGPSTADIQKAQLTGEKYDASGQLVSTGLGKVGDPSAQLTGVTDSISILSNNFFKILGNPVSSYMLKSLTAIKDNTADTAGALTEYLSGVAPGGIPKSSRIAAAGGSNNWFQGVGDVGLAGLASLNIGGVIAGLGIGPGESVRAAVTDAETLRIQGTLKDLISGKKGTSGIDFNMAQEMSGGGWGAKSDIRRWVERIDLPPAVQEKIKDSMMNVKSSMLLIGKMLGSDVNKLSDDLDNTVISIDKNIKGLKPEEQAAALLAGLNENMTAIVNKQLPWVEALRKTGEDTLTAAVRLVKNSETVDYGLDLLNKAVDGVTKTTKTSMSVLSWLSGGALFTTTEVIVDSVENKIKKQQQIINNFGGNVDDFASAIQGYYDVMYTDKEKATKSWENVNKQLKILGYAGVTTKEELRAIVESLDPTTQAFADVVKLAPDFTSALDGLKTIADNLAATKLDQTIQVYQLLGDAEAVLALQREKELAALDDSLKPTQKYIYALQDEAKARAKLNTVLTDTLNRLKTSIKTLSDYKATLLTGSNSLASPQSKYATTKQSLESLKAIIQGPTDTAAQQAAQADAISKLPAASDAFLQASKDMYASSAQYAVDYQSVLDFVDSTSGILTQQQTDAQKQLDLMNQQAASLGIIADNTGTAAQLMTTYLASVATAQTASLSATLTAVPAHARGGYASGISLVGEDGPELVDFNTPGRVYTAEQTFGMFNGGNNNSATLNELRALRAEIAQLREQQRQETGSLINATYDSQNQNAQVVTDAVVTTANTQIWAAKTQAAAKIV